MADPKDRYIAEAAEHGRCTESGDYKRGNAALIGCSRPLPNCKGTPIEANQY